MNISDTTLRVFYESGERAGWVAFWKEQAEAVKRGLCDVTPEDTKNVHNLQQMQRIFSTHFPRIAEKVDQYAAQRAATSQSAVTQ